MTTTLLKQNVETVHQIQFHKYEPMGVDLIIPNYPFQCVHCNEKNHINIDNLYRCETNYFHFRSCTMSNKMFFLVECSHCHKLNFVMCNYIVQETGISCRSLKFEAIPNISVLKPISLLDILNKIGISVTRTSVEEWLQDIPTIIYDEYGNTITNVEQIPKSDYNVYTFMDTIQEKPLFALLNPDNDSSICLNNVLKGLFDKVELTYRYSYPERHRNINISTLICDNILIPILFKIANKNIKGKLPQQIRYLLDNRYKTVINGCGLTEIRSYIFSTLRNDSYNELMHIDEDTFNIIDGFVNYYINFLLLPFK